MAKDTSSNETYQDDMSFIPPSVISDRLLSGDSYAYYTPCPAAITTRATTSTGEAVESTSCVLGVDEAGRGPVLGPMVYGAFYLPIDLHLSLLAQEHSFDDSKVLTPAVRANLMRLLNTPGQTLYESCGYAIKVLSARDISAGMMKPKTAVYNLNAQAMDATIEIIRGVVEDRQVDVREVYIDTIGNPATYQQKLEKIFPTMKITVAKKADSLYPCVSAASVAAKVTRDVALEVMYEDVLRAQQLETNSIAPEGWGSGYPSDSKCVGWLRRNMDPVFGWGNECRFSWGTAKEMLENKGGARIDWPDDDEEGAGRLNEFLLSGSGKSAGQNGLRDWYGSRQAEII
ncbi:Ribonuclease H2 subunit A [Penicillium taxi]|uniref:Ribonuclease H2 subunit A n=1 Tax=Penicillium taxi TaxID=168475 RepID=UPI002544E1DB|nr:Ribonuclease H2 subunit A [Penicillium taxi]KAJ5888857.1 Ribonuclease H2 subunit A [Penicillium taxi]